MVWTVVFPMCMLVSVVLAQEIRTPPWITQHPQDAVWEVFNGPNLNFSCNATGIPTPNITWLRSVGGGPWERLHTMSTAGYLLLKDVTEAKHRGRYRCVASNIMGAAVSRWAVALFGYLNEFPNSARESIRVDKYRPIIIECNPPSHYPDNLKVFWVRAQDQTKRLVSDHRRFISRATQSLMFSHVTSDDSGLYTCVINKPDQLPQYSKPIPLRVNDQAPANHNLSIPGMFPAISPTKPRSGSNVTLECMAFGTSNQTYMWTREEWDFGYRYQRVMVPRQGLVELTNYNRTLTLLRPTPADEGKYTCVVSDRYTMANRSVELRLYDPPAIVEWLTPGYVKSGGNATFICRAEVTTNTHIPIKYTWFHDATELKTTSGHVIINGTNLTLIGAEKSRDAGIYQCQVEHIDGNNITSTELRVTGDIKDPCGSSPCHYVASCISSSDSYDCVCPLDQQYDWSRHACRTTADPCASYPCPGEATCVRGIGFYQCLCPPYTTHDAKTNACIYTGVVSHSSPRVSPTVRLVALLGLLSRVW